MIEIGGEQVKTKREGVGWSHDSEKNKKQFYFSFHIFPKRRRRRENKLYTTRRKRRRCFFFFRLLLHYIHTQCFTQPWKLCVSFFCVCVCVLSSLHVLVNDFQEKNKETEKTKNNRSINIHDIFFHFSLHIDKEEENGCRLSYPHTLRDQTQRYTHKDLYPTPRKSLWDYENANSFYPPTIN